MRAYRERFVPSATLKSPQGSIGIFAFCGDTDEKVAQVQAVMDFRLLSIAKGKVDEAPSYESVKSYQYTREELAYVLQNRGRMICGTPDVVKEKITAMASRFGVEEVVISTFADRFEDRLRSYELLSELFSLTSTEANQVNTVASR
jgi:alkanesulfonate monooxygenase SsuD/methylene tetrahydromethanopterin reductase-like flavin-dependent oxidoreductase (luciferase family)